MATPSRNPDFDTTLSAQVDPGGKPIHIAGVSFDPADVLSTMDPVAYEAALTEWTRVSEPLEDVLARARSVLTLSASNRERFERLSEVVQRNQAIPFVGAGLSHPCGNPLWREFLLRLAGESGMDVPNIAARLNAGGYEQVAEEIVAARPANWFNERLTTTYKRDMELAGAVLRLPRLFQGCLITTNFDAVLETVYKQAACAFDHRVIGGNEGGFTYALSQGEHHLLKLHGDLEYPTHRVLTYSEYVAAYGDTAFDFSLPLPKAIKGVYENYFLVFLGCSLGADRTMDLWDYLITAAGSDAIPRHIAIIESPEVDRLPPDREDELVIRNIFPIWYPKDQHQAVDDLLALLDAVVNEGESIDR
ncbi:MAG: SIR2 family protein [Bacteroidota bacterium]